MAGRRRLLRIAATSQVVHPFPRAGFRSRNLRLRKVSLSGGDSPSARQDVNALSMLVVSVVVEDRAADVSASRAVRQSAAASYEIRTLVPTCISRGARPCDFSL